MDCFSKFSGKMSGRWLRRWCGEEGAGHQAWGHEFDPKDPHGRQREQTLANGPLTTPHHIQNE